MFAPRRTLLALALVALAVVVSATQARAQSCHAPDVSLSRDEPFRAILGSSFAEWGHGGADSGMYQSLYAGLAYQSRWLGGEVMLPTYRLDRKGKSPIGGVGDLVLTARATALHVRDDTLLVGVELPVMFPTGDESRSLGMGKVMFMPAVWLSLDLEPLVVRASVGYGKMVGDHDMPETGGHHHHGGSGATTVMRMPIVNPMNASEFEHSLAVILGVEKHVSVHGRWLGAVPVDDPHGVTRQTIALGGTVDVDRFDFSAEVQRPVKGDAFDWKLVLQGVARF